MKNVKGKGTQPKQVAKVQTAAADVYSKKSVVDQKKYKTVEVSGQIHSLSRKDEKEYILYIATNASQIEMACRMSEQSKYDSYIYSEGFDFYDTSLDYARASFVSSIKAVAAILKRITKVVTYIGQVNSNVKKEYRSLISAVLKLELPLIELPHGLIQSGYNLDDDSRFIDLSSYYDGIGMSLPSISSMRLTWYGENSVGYPRSNSLNLLRARVVPAYTLVTTNTNWFLYSVEDKRNFFAAVFKYAEQNPTRLFIWSPHPAETNDQTYSSHVVPLRPANVLSYGLAKDIYFDGIEGTNELIAHCSEGISTVSTCLLEYEMFKKNVQIFSTKGVADVLASFASYKSFSSLAELSIKSKPLITGMLEEYSPERFDRFLDWAPKSDPKNSIFMDLV